MPIFATAGAKLFIGGEFIDTGVDVAVSDFSSEVWVEVKALESLGTLGDAASEIAVELIDQQRTKRIKGTRAAPPMEVICAIDYADAGQLAMIAAEKSPNDYAFKVVFNDAPSGGTPSERYFIGQVASSSETYDTANSVMKLNCTIWVNSNVARVAAAGP
jgi:hypothetical protein